MHEVIPMRSIRLKVLNTMHGIFPILHSSGLFSLAISSFTVSNDYCGLLAMMRTHGFLIWRLAVSVGVYG